MKENYEVRKLFNAHRDERPAKGAWAPGKYFNTCHQCEKVFVGDKMARECANCAWGPPEEQGTDDKPKSNKY